MININGVYECRIDAKGRFPFPAALKKQLASQLADGFFMKRGIFQPYIELYTMEVWQLEKSKLIKINEYQSKNVEFVRKLLAYSREVELDPAGRLMISKDLASYAGITKDIVVATAINKMEIWDKKAYEKSIEFTPQEFAADVERIMTDEVYKDIRGE
ncbi:MAG: hypothetical protein M0R21_02680 [Lentimicrobiaceae bacterium]|nr:hypothetical protein [Lentimicrobiaceae bacterium]